VTLQRSQRVQRGLELAPIGIGAEQLREHGSDTGAHEFHRVKPLHRLAGSEAELLWLQ
jgi:hypothetical protein